MAGSDPAAAAIRDAIHALLAASPEVSESAGGGGRLVGVGPAIRNSSPPRLAACSPRRRRHRRPARAGLPLNELATKSS
jgi:hypothetical protein